MKAVYRTNFPDIKLLRSGKVRDVYDLDQYLMIVASDRISAFDVIMEQPVAGKGRILSEISAFWFNKLSSIIPNHLVSTNIDEFPEVCRKYKEELAGRTMLVKKCEPLPVEFVVRGYITGSGWKEYLNNGKICGIELPQGLIEFQRLPEPIFTPSTKEETGHDINIDFERTAEILGPETAEKLKDSAVALYRAGANYLEENGIILADTKFEFGIYNEELILIDEAMTPDSSRFWLKEDYAPGKEQTNFDKQVLRDYLESLDWDKTPPPPELPVHIIEKTLDKYNEALKRIVK